MIWQQELSLQTTGHGEMHDLTEAVVAAVERAGVMTGMINIFHLGSTGAIGAIEFEPGLQRDLPEMLLRLIPPSRDYGHEQTWRDGNGHSHLQATLLGPSLTVPIKNGRPSLGTWQQVFFVECDIRPRKRTVVMTIYGE
jgi:secondary thiamine-phosphate synthase enzyme